MRRLGPYNTRIPKPFIDEDPLDWKILMGARMSREKIKYQPWFLFQVNASGLS